MATAKELLQRQLSSLINTAKAGVNQLSTELNAPRGPNQVSISQAIKQTAPTVAQDFGNLYRQNLPGIVGQMVGNVGQQAGNVVSNIVSGTQEAFSGRPIQGVAQAAKGVGQFYTAINPLTLAANIGSQIGTDQTKRISTGVLKGMTFDQGVSPNVQANKWLNIPVIGQVDPLMGAGEMYGFTKNALNKKLYSATAKYFPTQYQSIPKWIATTGGRGSIENIVQTLDQMPDDPIEATKYLAQNALLGSVMEIGGQAIGEVGKKAINLKQVQELKKWLNAPVLEKVSVDKEGGFNKYRSVPRWQSLSTRINTKLEEKAPFGMTVRPISDVERAKLQEVAPSGKIKTRGFVESVQKAENISPELKVGTQGTYTPKSNIDLMGEAKSLLNEGASINFNEVKGIDKKVPAAIQEALNLDASGDHTAAANLFNNLAEAGTEGGRFIQSFSLLSKMSPEAISLSAAARIKKYNATHSTKIPELSGDQQRIISDQMKVIETLTGREKNIALGQLEKTINSFIPSSIADKFLTVWKAGLLTSLRTHERNLIGNTIMTTAEVAKDPVAAAIDQVMALRTGQRSTSFTLSGMGSGAVEGVQAAGDMMKYGFDPEETITKFNLNRVNWGNNPVERALEAYTSSVFKALGAEDKIFFKSAFARSLYDQAITAAKNAGEDGNKSFIKNLVANPTEEMKITAIKDANYVTFKDSNKINQLANSIKNWAKQKWYTQIPVEIIAPFTGVPSSVAGKTIDYSPIGLIKGATKVSQVLIKNVPELQRQAAQELARGIVGTGVMGLGAYLMQKGLMTGQPKDAKEAALWQAQGKQANSILVDGKWRSINSVGPQTLVLLAGAKIQEERQAKEPDYTKLGAGMLQDQLNQTFLQGMMGPLNAITDPARYGTSYVGNTIASAVPNIVKDAARATDPYARETPKALDYVKLGIPKGTPFSRNTLVAKRDILGDIVPQEPTGLNAFFDVFNSKTPKDTLILNELARLNDTGNAATPSRLTANQTILKQKLKLTAEQLSQLEAGSGELVKQSLQSLISSPSYQQLTDEQKANAIQNAVNQTRAIYKAKSGGQFLLTQPGVNQKIPTTQVQTQTMSKFDKPFVLASDTGSTRIIDLSQPIERPQLTGDTLLDKKLIAKYNSVLSSRSSDVVKLFEDGQITKEDAVSLLNELEVKKSGTKAKKGKKITVKKVSLPAQKAIKIGTIKMKSAKLKLQRPKFGKVPVMKKVKIK